MKFKQQPIPSFDARLHETNVVYVEQHLEQAREAHKYAVEFALLALRTLIIVNGGAVVGMVTFLGHFPRYVEGSNLLWWAFALFLSGVVVAMIASMLAYFTQLYLASEWSWSAVRVYRETLNQDVTEANAKVRSATKMAERLRLPAVIFGILSIITFAVGSTFALMAVVDRPTARAAAQASTAHSVPADAQSSP